MQLLILFLQICLNKKNFSDKKTLAESASVFLLSELSYIERTKDKGVKYFL